MIRFIRIESPLGPLLATQAEGRLTGLWFGGGRHAPAVVPEWREDAASPLLRDCARQVAAYFRDPRFAFELPLAAAGSDFQRRVWREIARVSPGETLSYAQLARRAGAEGCARAAGAATGRNPFSIVVPCHRIVGSRGELTGYAGGIERKARLLELEGALARVAA